MDTINHFTHEHPLKLRDLFFADDKPPDLLHCGGCDYPIRGPIYCCEPCKYVLHRSCAEFPPYITHPFHPQHPAEIFVRKNWPHRSNGREVPRHTLSYCCFAGCGFEITGVDAMATMPDEEGSDRETLKHVSHEHPLAACRLKRECRLECSGCKRTISGQTYVCYDCRFVLHEECAKLSESVEHPFHTAHPLNLVSDPEGLSKCVACKKPGALFYSCNECQYCLDVSCAAATLTTKNQREGEGSVISHLAHEHELARFHVKSEIRARCAFCSKFLSSGDMYGCPRCGFFLHEACAQESVEIAHPFHPEHTLTLRKADKSVGPFIDLCFCCYRGSGEYHDYYFGCRQCGFNLDIVCFLESLAYFKGGGSMEIEHFLHEHPLRFSRNPVKTCEICRDITNGPSYFCSTMNCNFWLHKSCAELPSTKDHPFHPLHQLSRIHTEASGIFTCNACNIKSNTSAFSCVECSFHLDSSCALRTPDFKHPLHEHKLAYFPETEQLKCNACGDSCNLDLYRCVQCNFNLHRSCLELPKTVKHGRHWHLLTLYDKYLEDDTGEYYCEICETRRHPDRGVYCCMSCEFFAHIECALAEVKARRPAITYIHYFYLGNDRYLFI